MNRRKQKQVRHARIRNKVAGVNDAFRLSVFKSQKHIYAQIIDDQNAKTLVSSSDLKMKDKQEDNAETKTTMKIQRAFAVGEKLASKAMAKKIKKVVFDTGGNRYHGRVKSLAEGARKGGLVF